VGVGTSLFYEPHSCKRINAGVAEYLGANKMSSVAELIGSLDAPKKVVQACAC
jgi:dihydroorotate dehydrogenase (NAD+) catalytic subunit